MKTFAKRVERFVKSEDGPTAVEYAVMLALISVALITVIKNLSTGMSQTFSSVNSNLTGTAAS